MIIETLTLLGLTATQLGYAALSMIGVFTVIFYLIALDRAGGKLASSLRDSGRIDG